MFTRLLASITTAVITIGVASFASAPAASAADLTLDFSAYSVGTTIDNVSIPGVTFVAASPSTVTVVDASTIRVIGAAGNDLSIFVTNGQASSLHYQGYGSCQNNGYDMLGLNLDSTPVDSFVTFVPFSGRCTNGDYQRTMAYNEITVEVADGNEILLSNITLDADVPPAAEVPSTPVKEPILMWVQSYGRHNQTDGCLDGWNPSWEMWMNEGTGGWVCTREIPSLG